MLGQGIPYISFPQALGLFLIQSRTSLVVAGTHGKTTTSALAAWVLSRAGLDPGFLSVACRSILVADGILEAETMSF